MNDFGFFAKIIIIMEHHHHCLVAILTHNYFIWTTLIMFKAFKVLSKSPALLLLAFKKNTVMAVLRSGKNTIIKKKEIKIQKINRKYKLKEFEIKLVRLRQCEIQKYLQSSSSSKYNLRQRTIRTNTPELNTQVQINAKERQVANIQKSNVIWRNLIKQTYELRPTDIVIAKMGSFRPWPARINSIYKVGNVLKCYVLFYGTHQIGSVPKHQCVKICSCDLLLFHTIDEIKKKYNWELDYEKLSNTEDVERALVLQKLTQVQKYLLAVRDVERLRQIPFDLSMLQSV